MDYLADLEHMMAADNVFYTEELKHEPRPRSLSLSIGKPDWSSMLNTGERSMRITDTLLDTPEILSQCVDWQLHSRQPEAEVVQHQNQSSYLIPDTVDETTQITAIKKELQNDYEQATSPQVLLTHSPAAVYYYGTDVETACTENGSPRAGDGSLSPALSEAHSSMVADDECDEEWYPSGERRVGRPRSSATSCSTTSTKSQSREKANKRKISEIGRESTEYQEKRKRNNIAVRKSRDKAKRHHVEVEERNQDLAKQNTTLRKQNESLVREVSVLRKLITDIGRKIPSDLSSDLDNFCT